MKQRQSNYQRRARVQGMLYEVSFYLELIAALIVIILILAQTVGLVYDMVTHSDSLTSSEHFTFFLEKCLNIVIGIEFLKMLCRHNMDAVIEVLLFTLARHLIVKQFAITEGLICVIAISILFVVRKFLFVPHMDDKKHIESEADAEAKKKKSGTDNKPQ